MLRITNSVKRLDDSQRQAIVHALSYSFALIQGHPVPGSRCASPSWLPIPVSSLRI
jgi:hypothetical protein